VDAATGLTLQARVPFGPVRVLAELQRRQLREGEGLLDFSNNTTALVAGRVRLASWFFVNTSLFRRLEVNRALGQLEAGTGYQTDLELAWPLD
jgi:hypothetical protein